MTHQNHFVGTSYMTSAIIW